MQDIPIDLSDKLIFGKYRIIKEEGNGLFSTVYSAKNITNQEIVALKIQEKTKIFGDLEKEAYCLFQLKGIGIPKVITYGHSGKYKILAQELLGKSLGQLFKENIKRPKEIRLKDMIMAGIQIIERIQFIHTNYIIHLDIKPANFLVGKKDKSLIYIIDFGFARKYRSSRTGKHVKFSKNSYFSGNLKYSSINTMKGVIPSRRDDLESIGYMLIYLFKQKLPWDKVIYKNKKDLAQKIYEIKSLIPIKMLCEDLPKEMMEYMEYVRNLKFEEEPKYDYLKKILNLMLERINTVNDLNFSWINQTFSRNITTSPNNLISNLRKKVSPFSKIFKNIEKQRNNNYTEIAILNKDLFFDEERNKDYKSITKNKSAISAKNSIDKKMKFNQTINKEIINRPNIKKSTIKNKYINTYNPNYDNKKIINSRNVLTTNSIINKPNYQSIKNNNINYYLFIGQVMPNKDVNTLANKSNKLNINSNQNFSSNNSNKKLKIKKPFLRHFNTNNYIGPFKNGLLNIYNEEKLCNDIVYKGQYKK